MPNKKKKKSNMPKKFWNSKYNPHVGLKLSGKTRYKKDK
tara:strand:- start:72948 stop:73064 length:117 start_codon:yes stop_codon:yes gene_type:complete